RSQAARNGKERRFLPMPEGRGIRAEKLMTLKRTGLHWQALLAALVALALFAYEAVVIGYLVKVGDWSGLLNPLLFFAIPFLMIVCMLNVLAAIAPVLPLARQRTLRAAAQGDYQATPLATVQPNRSLALAAGETLTLTRLPVRGLL